MLSQLDRGTLDVVTMVVAIVPAAVAISIWRINRAQQGPLFWMLAITLSLLTYAAVPVLQWFEMPPGVAVAMNNTSSLTGMLLLLEGNLRFTGRHDPRRLRVWGVLVLVFLVVSIVNRDDAARRYLFHDAFASALLLANAATLLLGAPAFERRIRAVAAVFPLMMTAVFMSRWWIALHADADADLARHPIVMPLMLAGIVFTLGWTYFASVFCYTRSQAELAKLAREDPLTGLANRRYFDEAMQREIARCRRTGSGFALVTLDLDGFKRVNDRLGHAAGDRMLLDVSDRLLAFIRRTDLAARMGGDEFALLLVNVDSREILEGILTRLRPALERPGDALGDAPPIAASLGSALWPLDGDDVDVLLRASDESMYADKARRRLGGADGVGAGTAGAQFAAA
jgi:diguanylate cyclase (GGDEF)-like protein